jgi:uncharacterized protein with NRDE domain
MCIVFFIKNSFKYKLIIAGNRDEFLSRPSSRAHFWSDFPSILGGVDQGRLGTWMGINTNGDFSFLTNVRTHPSKLVKKKSRGLLVSNYLKTGNSLFFLQNINSKEYSPYFLVVGNVNDCMYLASNSEILELKDNIVYGLSNAPSHDEKWPKVEIGKKKFSEIINDECNLVEKLFNLLKDVTQPCEEDMPEPVYNKEIEQELSSICVDCMIGDERYGTRTHTVILVDYQDNVYFEEIDRYQDGNNSCVFEFKLNS